MTPETIRQLAEQAHPLGNDWYNSDAALYRFAALVAATEREECAKMCEEHAEFPSLTPWHCAQAIRARGQA